MSDVFADSRARLEELLKRVMAVTNPQEYDELSAEIWRVALEHALAPIAVGGDTLPRAEIKYRLLFENSMDGILLKTPDGRIFDANPSACSILGRTREEIIAAGRQGLMVFDAALAGALDERRRAGKVHCELVARRPDGTTFPMEVSSAIFRDADQTEFTCLIFRDISRKKQAELEREQMIAQLQDALAKVKELSGLLSICASCKKIRDEQGNWEMLEVYIRDRSAADFSHGLCPDCFKKLYPDFSPR